jgi:hypothetical protein
MKHGRHCWRHGGFLLLLLETHISDSCIHTISHGLWGCTQQDCLTCFCHLCQIIKGAGGLSIEAYLCILKVC